MIKEKKQFYSRDKGVLQRTFVLCKRCPFQESIGKCQEHICAKASAHHLFSHQAQLKILDYKPRAVFGCFITKHTLRKISQKAVLLLYLWVSRIKTKFDILLQISWNPKTQPWASPQFKKQCHETTLLLI